MADELKIIALDNAICESDQLVSGEFSYTWTPGEAQVPTSVSQHNSSKGHKVTLESSVVTLSGGVSTTSISEIEGTFSFTSDIQFIKMDNQKPLRIGLEATSVCAGVTPQGDPTTISITIKLVNPPGYEPVLFGE